MFYQSDSVYTCIAVDCQTASKDYSRAYLSVTIKTIKNDIGENIEAFVSPMMYLSMSEGEEPIRVKTEIQKLVFHEDNECYKQVRALAEAIAESPLGHINNEAMSLANANYLMCLIGKDKIEFQFINAPSNDGFKNEVKVKDNMYALKALRNFATDMRKFNEKNKPVLGE